MPLYLEDFGDRMAATFGGRGSVVFEVKEENLPSANKIEAVNMYNKEGKILGKITYAILPDNKVEIQGFNIDDWTAKLKYGPRLLKWYVSRMRRRGFMSVMGGIFSTDTRTHDKLEIFKEQGFLIKEMGSMAGHTEYQEAGNPDKGNGSRDRGPGRRLRARLAPQDAPPAVRGGRVLVRPAPPAHPRGDHHFQAVVWRSGLRLDGDHRF
jgi:hypothetical protein